jgi:outer membrane receptor protein involved in Fe transport
MVPKHKVAWGVNLNPADFIEFNFNSEYVSEQFSINDDRNMLPKLKPHFVCNAKVALKHKGVEVFFGINNIFDARYAEIAASSVAGTVTDLHPSPARNYVFGASWEF